MKVIHKYPFTITDYFNIALPEGAIILSAQAQFEEPQMWVLVDSEAPQLPVIREFRLAGTGHTINEPAETLHHISTFQMQGGVLIWHLFEIISPKKGT